VPPHHPYSPDLAHYDFFHLPKEVRATSQHQLRLTIIILTQNTFKSILEWAIRSITIEEFSTAYRR
jgi:hypothetical protein